MYTEYLAYLIFYLHVAGHQQAKAVYRCATKMVKFNNQSLQAIVSQPVRHRSLTLLYVCVSLACTSSNCTYFDTDLCAAAAEDDVFVDRRSGVTIFWAPVIINTT